MRHDELTRFVSRILVESNLGIDKELVPLDALYAYFDRVDIELPKMWQRITKIIDDKSAKKRKTDSGFPGGGIHYLSTLDETTSDGKLAIHFRCYFQVKDVPSRGIAQDYKSLTKIIKEAFREVILETNVGEIFSCKIQETSQIGHGRILINVEVSKSHMKLMLSDGSAWWDQPDYDWLD